MAKYNVLCVDTDTLKYGIKEGFCTEGNKINIEITIPYSSLETVRDIKRCSECPVGYMKYNCGRNVPMDYGCAPETCKLKKKHLSDLLRLIADSVDISNMIER